MATISLIPPFISYVQKLKMLVFLVVFSKIQDRNLENNIFRYHFLKVLPNAVILRYCSLESVHGARR